MAEANSWESIKRHGLLSTTALLELFEIQDDARVSIESEKRPNSIEIHHPVCGNASIRDNRPINETVLNRTLVGISTANWYRTLNSRVFFWLTEDRLDRLRGAPAYRGRAHDILTVDTEKLVSAHETDIELCHLNSGAVHPGANYPRGLGSFQRIASYPWSQRCAVAPAEPIVELTVPYSVPNIETFIVDVRTR